MKSANRIVPFELNGETYCFLYNMRAGQVIQDRAERLGYPSVNDFLFESKKNKIIENVLHVAEVLAAQGARYREMAGEKDTPVISAEALDIILSPEDFSKLYSAVVAAMAEGHRQDVEASAPPAKKENATEAK